MLIRPHRDDIRLIGFYLGRILALTGLVGVLPLLIAVMSAEWGAIGWYMVMIGVGLLLGGAAEWIRPHDEPPLRWGDGMVVVALTWVLIPLLGSIPLYLSGRFGSFLDAAFEGMSGFTATGLTVLADLDHLPTSLTVWRQTTQFLGGQGIVLAALTVFAGGGILALYHGEARDERILPSVTSTARFIWAVSVWHGLMGITALALIGVIRLGYEPNRALLHAYSIFVGAFDTGGFSPMSTSLAYYRSPAVEFVTAWLMIAGTLSFGVHFTLFRGPRKVWQNLETKTLIGSYLVTSTVAMLGLVLIGSIEEPMVLLRRGVFHVVSAHTSTGFSTVSSSDLASWGGLTFAAIATAMALGGMGSSTSGGVKALRIGLTLKTLANTIREILLPEHTVIRRTYIQNGRRQLTNDLAQSVMAVSLLFVALYLVGALVGIAHGYPLQDALFESVSAAGTVGLSVGITSPSMPDLMKVVYMLLMWAGRLEFIAIFALIGFTISSVVGE